MKTLTIFTPAYNRAYCLDRCYEALKRQTNKDFDWLINIEKEKIIEKANNHEICFEEENFDAFLKRLSVYPQIEYLDDVIEHSWGQRVVRFYDLDKHIIEVGESMKMVINRFIDRGMTMEQISKKMDVSVADLKKLLND